MLSRDEHRRNLKEMRYNLSQAIIRLRMDKKQTIEQTSFDAKIPLNILRDLERGEVNHFGYLFAVAKFFDKKVRIEFY